MRPAPAIRALPASTPRVSRFSAPLLPLDFFINRSKALALYRAFIRATKGLGDADARRETVRWIRVDFERYREVIDSDKSKVLLALGHRQLKQLNSTGMLVGNEGSKWRGGRG